MLIHSLFFALISNGIVSALECYTCDSAEISECATRPGQQIDVEECPIDNDECITRIDTGHTKRGCLSRHFPNKYCPEPCERCRTSLCNRNIFPANRLRCFQCLGSDCVIVANKTGLLLPCPVYAENDRCYTNIINARNVQRGCEKTNLPVGCPNICLKCNYNGCNNEPGVHEDKCLQCISYKSSPNPYCWRDISPVLSGRHCQISAPAGSERLKSCNNKVLYGHRAKCYTYMNRKTGFTQRGCSEGSPFFEKGNMTECYGEDCNKRCLPITCSVCSATSGTENSQCRNGENVPLEVCSDDTFSCYACEGRSNTLVRRGCLDKSFAPSNSSSESCYYCSDSDGCNSKIALRTCYHCSSANNDDANCADATWDSDRVGKSLCASQAELCVSTIVSKLNMVFVVRGCASSVPDCTEFDPYCVRCNGSLCNDVPIELTTISTVMDLHLHGSKSGSGGVQKLSQFGMQTFGLVLIYKHFFF